MLRLYWAFWWFVSAGLIIGVNVWVRFFDAPANSTNNYLLVTYWPLWLALVPFGFLAFVAWILAFGSVRLTGGDKMKVSRSDGEAGVAESS